MRLGSLLLISFLFVTECSSGGAPGGSSATAATSFLASVPDGWLVVASE